MRPISGLKSITSFGVSVFEAVPTICTQVGIPLAGTHHTCESCGAEVCDSAFLESCNWTGVRVCNSCVWSGCAGEAEFNNSSKRKEDREYGGGEQSDQERLLAAKRAEAGLGDSSALVVNAIAVAWRHAGENEPHWSVAVIASLIELAGMDFHAFPSFERVHLTLDFE